MGADGSINHIHELLAIDTTMLDTPVSYMEAKLMLRQAYDRTIGTYSEDGNEERDIVQGVAMSSRENAYRDTVMDVRIRDYRRNRIKELFGLDLIQYMELPTAEIIKINKDSVRASVEDAKAEDAKRKELESKLAGND